MPEHSDTEQAANDREKEADRRREARRRQRKRAQLGAWILAVFLLLLLGVGIFLLARLVMERLRAYRANWIPAQETVEPPAVEEEAPAELLPETEEAAEEVRTEAEMLESIVEACIAEMPLEDRVAGLFMITPEQLTGVDAAVRAGEGTQAALTEHAVGGLVYADKNIKSGEQITEMLSGTGAMSKYQLFFAAKEEGGDRSPVADGIPAEHVSGPDACADEEAAYAAGAGIAEYLSDCGFNLNLAPEVDVAEGGAEDDAPYGTDAEHTARIGVAFARGLQENGVSACMKYFPIARKSSEEAENGIERAELTQEELRASQYQPFRAGIDAGVQMIMVTDLSIPGLIGDNTPACLSEAAIRGELRGELGFEGVIVTAALNRPSVTDYYTPGEAAIAAISAGADVIYQPEDFTEAYEALLEAVQSGAIAESRIEESLRRIYRVKFAGRVN